MSESQQVIFKHPQTGQVFAGVVSRFGDQIFYFEADAERRVLNTIDCSDVTEWCDAEAAAHAWALQTIRMGNTEKIG